MRVIHHDSKMRALRLMILSGTLLLSISTPALHGKAQRNDGNFAPYKFLFSFPHDDIVTCAAFSRDGRWLATGSELGTVIVTDLATQKQRKFEGLHPEGNGVYVLNFSSDGELLLTAGSGSKNTGQIKILQTSDYSAVQTLDAHLGNAVDFLQISNDRNWLLSADRTRVNVWDFKAKAWSAVSAIGRKTFVRWRAVTRDGCRRHHQPT